MNKTIVLIHGWADKPTRGWMQDFVTKMQDNEYNVVAPQMPNAKKPSITAWVECISKVVSKLDTPVILIGHSLGAYCLVEYLATKKVPSSIVATILIAGLNVQDQKTGEYRLSPAQLNDVKKHSGRIISIYSQDDEIVVPAKSLELHDALGGETRELNGYGHFVFTNTLELPELVTLVKSVE